MYKRKLPVHEGQFGNVSQKYKQKKKEEKHKDSECEQLWFLGMYPIYLHSCERDLHTKTIWNNCLYCQKIEHKVDLKRNTKLCKSI